ncbi:DUF58 domain-containing protein [Marinivivus vitaminiproducens]|uniref:DUF58 domain-containing protein n=1 Tax=Marinivivus vitaminiproducens TaxID=3035935 RepID=UPI0027A09637|nr:DUF58 domain-containing protein [Geminicoccaceae bacterium SCSIO 64248]
MARAAGGIASVRQRAEPLAERLPPLLVAAEQVAATVAQGVHGRRRVGVGETFWQYRPYRPGDSRTAIDWRQSARSDHVYVRELEWEAAESVWLWADGSANMAYSSDRDLAEKGDRALLILFALAALLVRAGERVALLGDHRRPSSGRAALTQLGNAVLEAGKGDGLPPAPPLPRHCRLVLISDFLRPSEALAERIKSHVAAGVRGHLLQVLDPAEETLPFQGRVRFEAVEGAGELLIGRVEGVREAYVRRLAAHRAALRDLARQVGWTFATHHTDRPPETALLALYTALAIKGTRLGFA